MSGVCLHLPVLLPSGLASLSSRLSLCGGPWQFQAFVILFPKVPVGKSFLFIMVPRRVLGWALTGQPWGHAPRREPITVAREEAYGSGLGRRCRKANLGIMFSSARILRGWSHPELREVSCRACVWRREGCHLLLFVVVGFFLSFFPSSSPPVLPPFLSLLTPLPPSCSLHLLLALFLDLCVCVWLPLFQTLLSVCLLPLGENASCPMR